MSVLTEVGKHKIFNGEQIRYRHFSEANQCVMTFSVFLPSRALQGYRVPVLYWLSGLTCTDDNFSVKSGAQRFAAEWGLALVMPDTSPRGSEVADAETYDLGQGAGFYVNATQAPWDSHFHMYDYVVHELPEIIEHNLPVTTQRSIFGHSMGGHGALVVALKNPGRYAAVSAFAPIAHPAVSPWGEQAFQAYLGNDQQAWAAYDSTALVTQATHRLPILIDQAARMNFIHRS